MDWMEKTSRALPIGCMDAVKLKVIRKLWSFWPYWPHSLVMWNNPGHVTSGDRV